MSQTEVDSAALQMEYRQLVLCRWGFFLIAAYFVLFLAAEIVVAAYLHEESAELAVPSPAQRYFALTNLVVTYLAGVWLLFRTARSRRWRSAAGFLLVALMVDAAYLMAFEDSAWADGQPRWRRWVELGIFGLGWIEFWCIAVLVGEFSIAARAQRLTKQTEWLGYAILTGLTVLLVRSAWMVPLTVEEVRNDPASQIILVAEMLLQLCVLVWVINLSMQTSLLAKFLSLRCDQIRGKLASRLEAGEDEGRAG